VQAFARQLADFMQIEILNQQGQFRFFRRLLNYDDWRVAGRPQSTQFLDYQVVNSDIEAERDHLRVGDHIVRVLTMKEAITETRPLVLDALLKIPANFYVVTEWTPLPADKARKEVNKRRRHFNMSKTGFVSQMGNDATKTNPRDVLVDESKQADIENLGDCLRALGDGQSLGDFSLTIVLYGRSRTELDQLVAEFTGVFTNADGNLFAETYNQLNAYFATVPGNYALNLRQAVSAEHELRRPVFSVYDPYRREDERASRHGVPGGARNRQQHALLLNLHTGDVAHTLILGMTGVATPSSADMHPSACHQSKWTFGCQTELTNSVSNKEDADVSQESGARIGPQPMLAFGLLIPACGLEVKHSIRWFACVRTSGRS
jgi:type IV secretion system protein TrbE